MSTPSIRLLHDFFAEEATLTALGKPYLLELLEGNPWFSDAIPFDVHGTHPEFRQKAVMKRLRQERFDAALLFPNSFRSAGMAWFGAVKQRVGFGRQGRSFLLTHAAKVPPHEIPLVDYYLSLTNSALQAIGGQQDVNKDEQSTPDRRTQLFITPEEEKLGDEIWQTLGLREPGRVVVLNGCSSNSVVKQWIIDYAAELSRRIEQELDMDVLLNCGPGETEIVREVIQKAKATRVFSMADFPMNIHTGKICIQRARLTISTDSGPLHMALAFGKAALVLLGPTGETYITNPTLRQTVLSRRLPCSPCMAKKRCPEKHHRCMLELTPDVVFDKLVDMLK